jgi:hypothetical protein
MKESNLVTLGRRNFLSKVMSVCAVSCKTIEDTDKVFEIEVAECLVAAVFLQAKAADIGYASVCWGDYAWAEGFTPKIKLIRDKTLMQGDAYCNHKYVLEE